MSNFPTDQPLDNSESSRLQRPISEDMQNKRDSLYNFESDVAAYNMGNRDSADYTDYPGVEESIYDFTAERNVAFDTNLFEATAHLVKGCLGSGLLIVHMGFMFAGLWTGMVVTILLGLLVANSMYMLTSSAHKLYKRLRLTRLSYPDVTEAAFATSSFTWLRKFSKIMRYIIDICLIAQLTGTCCVYQIMIARTTKIILEHLSTSARENDISIRYYLLMISGPLVLISMIRRLKFLAPFSFIADVFVGICVIATIYYSLQTDGRIADRPIWKSFGGFVKLCGITLFSLDGLGVVMPVENSMRKPQYFSVVLYFGMGIVITLVTVTGFFGYWGYGEHCMSPITMHMPSDTVPMILQFMLAIMLSVTFAVNFWVTFRVTWYYIGRRYEIQNRDWWERFYRVVEVLLITAVTLVFPYLMKLIIFVGSFFLAFTVFVFPALIESLVFHPEDQGKSIIWRFIKNSSLVILGIIFACSPFYSPVDVHLLSHSSAII